MKKAILRKGEARAKALPPRSGGRLSSGHMLKYSRESEICRRNTRRGGTTSRRLRGLAPQQGNVGFGSRADLRPSTAQVRLHARSGLCSPLWAGYPTRRRRTAVDNSRVNEAIRRALEAVRKQSRRSLPLRFMEGTMLVYALNLIYKLSMRSSLLEMRSSLPHPSAGR